MPKADALLRRPLVSNSRRHTIKTLFGRNFCLKPAPFSRNSQNSFF